MQQSPAKASPAKPSPARSAKGGKAKASPDAGQRSITSFFGPRAQASSPPPPHKREEDSGGAPGAASSSSSAPSTSAALALAFAAAAAGPVIDLESDDEADTIAEAPTREPPPQPAAVPAPSSPEPDPPPSKRPRVEIEGAPAGGPGTAPPPGAPYEPARDAWWRPGDPTPYEHVARTFAAVEATSSRLRTADLLADMFRAVLARSPRDLLAVLYLSVNRLGPDYEPGGVLGVGGSTLASALGEATGRTPAAIKAAFDEKGDLGDVALASRATQRTLYTPPPLTVPHVLAELRAIADTKGAGSGAQKRGRIKRLMAACRDVEIKYITRAMAGALRIGATTASVAAALARAFVLAPPRETPPDGGPVPALRTSAEEAAARGEAAAGGLEEGPRLLRRAYNEHPNWEAIVGALLAEAGEGEGWGWRALQALPRRVRLYPGVPALPMLARPSRGADEVLETVRGSGAFVAEFKYDGQRAQVHRLADGTVRLFSRHLEETTARFPEVAALFAGDAPPALALGDAQGGGGAVQPFILDAEIVAVDPDTGRLLPFQALASRPRKAPAEGGFASAAPPAAPAAQVALFAFDALYANGGPLVDRPLRARRAALRSLLREIPGRMGLARGEEMGAEAGPARLAGLLAEAVESACEGLICKALDEGAAYGPSERSDSWLKVKRDYVEGLADSFDLVPIGAFHGTGRRAGWYSPFLLACYDPATESYQAFCKCMTGFTDAFFRRCKEFYDGGRLLPGPRPYYAHAAGLAPDVWFDACEVWEVRGADLTVSPVHKAAAGLVDPDRGLSLRFPRFVRVRGDKSVEEATTSNEVAAMYRSQRAVQNSNDAARRRRGAEGGEGEEDEEEV